MSVAWWGVLIRINVNHLIVFFSASVSAEIFTLICSLYAWLIFVFVLRCEPIRFSNSPDTTAVVVSFQGSHQQMSTFVSRS